jgi:hypothetical protein
LPRSRILNEIEIELVIEGCIDGGRRIDHQQRIAVRTSFQGRIGSNVAVGSCSILNNELLTQPFGKPLANESGGYVGRTGRSERDNHSHRSCGIRLGPPDTQEGWRNQRAQAKVQDHSTRKFHGEAPNTSTSQAIKRRGERSSLR